MPDAASPAISPTPQPVHRPMLLPALVHAWRSQDHLQLGIGTPSPVVLAGMDSRDARFVLDLDGRRTRSETLAHAAILGLTPSRAERLLELLDTAECLGDGAADARALTGLGDADRSRLAPDLAAQSLLPPARTLGLDGLGRRRSAHVEVRGAGRLGAAVVTLLAAAGVGTVGVVDDRAVRPGDVAPLGPDPDAVGRPRSDAAVTAARRTAPSLQRDTDRVPDVVVLAGQAVVDPATADALLAAGVPHLPVSMLETTATVGPMVVPGHGACLRCVDLHRCDRDPDWPLVAAQIDPLAGYADRDRGPCDVVLATAAAALAALSVLTLLGAGAAGAPQPETGVSYALRLPDGRPRRRTYPPHPRCGCSWGATMTE